MLRNLFIISSLAILSACQSNQQPTPNPAANTTSSPSPAQPDIKPFLGKYEYFMDAGENAGGTPVFVGYFVNAKSQNEIIVGGEGYQTSFEVQCKGEFNPSNPNELQLVASKVNHSMFLEEWNDKIAKGERIVFGSISHNAGKLTIASEHFTTSDGGKECKNCELQASK